MTRKITVKDPQIPESVMEFESVNFTIDFNAELPKDDRLADVRPAKKSLEIKGYLVIGDVDNIPDDDFVNMEIHLPVALCHPDGHTEHDTVIMPNMTVFGSMKYFIGINKVCSFICNKWTDEDIELFGEFLARIQNDNAKH